MINEKSIQQSTSVNEFARGWTVLFAAFVGIGVSLTSMVYYATGIWVRPWQEEFGWTRAEIGAQQSISVLVLMLLATFAGRLIDLYGLRSVTTISLLGYGLLLLRRGTQLTRLYSIAVLPEARGLGVAEKLINSLGERALLRGKRFMRLEVAVGNAGAIALYKKLGFSQFGMYTDYYDDHTDALRMQKVLVPSKSVKPEIYPWYQQTTDFTCGPSALMMAMCALNNRYEMTQEKELSLWRTATTIFMMSGHGGCHPVGLALAAVNEGYAAKVVINRDVPLFVDGVRDANKKEIVENVEQQFMAEARKKGISVEISDWRVDVIDQTLKAGGAVLCLISTYAFDKKKVPHWVAITSCDSHCYYLHDPDASEGQPVEYQHIPVAREDFLRLASYGTRKVRTLVLLKKKK